MSSSLIKLIDVSLIPAALMVIAKVIGVFICIGLFQVNWNIRDYAGSIFTAQTVVSLDRLDVVSSYSDLLLLIAISIGVAWQLYRSIYLSSHNISPTLLAKLAQRNLTNLVSGSFDLFYNGAIWVVFSWLTAGTIILNALQQKTYPLIALLAVIAALSFTIALLRDVYHEIEHNRKHLGQQYVY